MTEPRINEAGKNTTEFILTIVFNILLVALQIADVAIDTFDLGAWTMITAAGVNSFYGMLRLIAKVKGIPLLDKPQE